MAPFRQIMHLLLFVLFPALSFAQKHELNFNVFNADPVLYNGRLYLFFPPTGTEGNQFLADRQFMTGRLRLRGIGYDSLMLNYDILNQQLVLRYQARTGAYRQIIVSDAWLETFSLNHMNFEFLETENGTKKIFQVIGKGPCRILYFRWKKIGLSRFHGSTNHMFSAPLREMNLSCNGRIRRYHNNKSFCSLFDPEARDEIKGYLHEMRINVRKADDDSVTGLINFCNRIYKNEEVSPLDIAF